MPYVPEIPLTPPTIARRAAVLTNLAREAKQAIAALPVYIQDGKPVPLFLTTLATMTSEELLAKFATNSSLPVEKKFYAPTVEQPWNNTY